MSIRAERNLIEVFRIWSASSGGRAWEGEGFSCASSPVGKRSFNQIFVTSGKVQPGALRDAVGWYAENGRPLRVRVRPEIETDITSALAGAGLQREGQLPCLFFTGMVPALADTGLLIETVSDVRTLADMAAVVAEGFDWAPEDVDRVFTPALLETPHWAGWVGYDGDVPVASTQLAVHEGVAGLYDVVTIEGHRRKGYGAAITRAGMAEGCRGGATS